MSQIQDIRELVDPRGTIYQVGTFEGWEVALAIAGPDSASAALVAASAATLIAPEVLIFINFGFRNNDNVEASTRPPSRLRGLFSAAPEALEW